MKHTHRLALLALCLPLIGCEATQETWSRYRHLPAGQDAAIWRPTAVSDADFDAQTAHPEDLAGGSLTTHTTAKPAADAVERVLTGHPMTLPVSTISKIGSSGQGGAVAPSGGP